MKRNLFFFFIYRIVSRLYFHLPVLFAHFFFCGMGVEITELLLMTYGLAITLGSKIAVILISLMKQKYIIAIGEILKVIGLILVVLGTQIANTNFWMPFLGQILGGTGFGIAVSTDSNLLGSITHLADHSLFGKIQTQSQTLMFIGTLAGGAAGGILFNYEFHWPFYASIATHIIAIITVLLITEEQSDRTNAPENNIVEITVEQNFWMNYYALSRAFMLATFVGFLPFFFIMLQLDLNLLGVVLGLFSISAFLSALKGAQTLKVMGKNSFMILNMGSLLISLLLFSFFNTLWVGLIAIALLGFSSGCVRPLTLTNLDIAKMLPQQRVSLLSSMEQKFSILNSIILVTGGYILIGQGFQLLMFQLAVAYVLLILTNFMLFTLRISKS